MNLIGEQRKGGRILRDYEIDFKHNPENIGLPYLRKETVFRDLTTYWWTSFDRQAWFKEGTVTEDMGTITPQDQLAAIVDGYKDDPDATEQTKADVTWLGARITELEGQLDRALEVFMLCGERCPFMALSLHRKCQGEPGPKQCPDCIRNYIMGDK